MLIGAVLATAAHALAETPIQWKWKRLVMGWVTDIQVSSAGEDVAVISGNDAVVDYDPSNLKIRGTIEQLGNLYGFSRSRDDSLIAVAYGWDALAVYDGQTRQQRWGLRVGGDITGVAFVGCTGVLAATQTSARVYSALTGSLLKTIQGSFSKVAISQDGQFLASVDAASPQTLEVRKIDNGEVLHKTALAWPHNTRLGFSPDGKFLALASSQALVILRTSDWAVQRVINAPQNYGSAFDFSPDGFQIAYLKSGFLTITHIASGATVDEFYAPMGLSARYAANGRSIFVGGPATCTEFDIWSRMTTAFVAHMGPIWSLAMNAGGSRLGLTLEDNSTDLIDGESGELVSQLDGAWSSNSAFCDATHEVAAPEASWQHNIAIYDSETGEFRARYVPANSEFPGRVAWLPSGGGIFVAYENRVDFVDRSSLKKVASYPWSGYGITNMIVSPDGRFLALLIDASRLSVVDLKTGTGWKAYDSNVVPTIQQIGFTPDSKRLVFSLGHLSTYIALSTETWSQVATYLALDGYGQVPFLGNGCVAVLANHKGQVQYLDMRTGATLATTKGLSYRQFALTSADGSTLALAGGCWFGVAYPSIPVMKGTP
ncbi:MAG: WD40 repeat domain-containing protein [Armatimonadetes bacterium]|nr:WD40 repeat domain-containing protein [Armatimonadota bacterium]